MISGNYDEICVTWYLQQFEEWTAGKISMRKAEKRSIITKGKKEEKEYSKKPR